jgi:hypothetical protein
VEEEREKLVKREKLLESVKVLKKETHQENINDYQCHEAIKMGLVA